LRRSVGHVERSDTDVYLQVTQKGDKRSRKILLEAAPALYDYMDAAGIVEDREGPPFRQLAKDRKHFAHRHLDRRDVWAIVKKYGRQVGIEMDRIYSRGVGRSCRMDLCLLWPQPGSNLMHATKLRLCISVVLAGCSALALAQTYNAYSACLTNYLSDQPSNGVWSYGYTDGLSGAFNLYNEQSSYYSAVGIWDSSSYNIALAPLIGLNLSGVPFNNGNVFLGTDVIGMSGCGPSGLGYSDVVFTAPSSGFYAVAGTFTSQQYNDDADYNVLVNGVDEVSGSITDASTLVSFDKTFYVASGDTIMFAAGPNGDFSLHPAWIGLTGTINLVPEPTSILCLAAGLGWFVRARRKSPVR
jgi:hypothetical protein